MIISLTGFMGCGKSSVGRRLSELLCCPFMDLDDVIVEREGRSIPDIFATDGEGEFRKMELEALMRILSTSEPRQCAPLAPSHCVGPSPYAGVRKCQLRTNALTPIENPSYHLGASSCHPERSEGSINLILALGGGTVMTPECAELVRENTVCIYLRASVDTLVEHLASEAAGRPLLADADLRTRIETLMQQRSATYEKTAHVTIDTDGKSIDEIARELGKHVAEQL